MSELITYFGGFQKGSVPSWGTFVVALVACGSLISKIWFKDRAVTLEEDTHERAGLEGIVDRLSAEVKAMQQNVHIRDEKIVELEKRVTESVAASAASTLRVSQLDFALRWALEEIGHHLPDSTIPAQIKSLLSASYPIPWPSGVNQADMDTLRHTDWPR